MSLISPWVWSKWSFWICVISIDNIVPDSMEFICRIVVLKSEHISSLISIRKVFGVSVTSVKRLMDIPIVVDKKSQSERFTLILRLDMLHDSLISNSIFGVTATEPGGYGRHGHRNILFVILDINIRLFWAIPNERLVIEVPVRLPTTSGSFIVIRKCYTLNKRMIFLVLLSESITVKTQEIYSFFESIWVLFLKDVLSNSRNE